MRIDKRPRHSLAALSFAVATCGLLTDASRGTAVSGTWKGYDGTWSVASNWTCAPDYPDGGGTASFLNAPNTGSGTVALDVSPTLSGIVVGSDVFRQFFNAPGAVIQQLNLSGAAEINVQKKGNLW